MAETIAQLLVKIGVEVKEATKGLDKVKGKLKETGKGAGFFGSILKKAAGVFSAGFIAEKAITEMAKFQTALTSLGVATRTSGKDLQRLGDEALRLSSKFGITAEEIVDGLKTLQNLGLDAEEALKVLPNILNAVVGAEADFHDTTAVVETALNDFNLKAEDSAHIVDVLVETLRQGNFNMTAWREALKEAGSAATSANASFEDVATALSILGKASITGGRAGTALRNIFLGINKQLAKGGPLFEKFGIEIKNSDGTFKNFAQIISSIQVAFKDLSAQEQIAFEQALVGKEAFSALDTIIKRTPESFDVLAQKMKETAGVAEASANAQLNTIEGQWNRTKTILSNAFKDSSSEGSKFFTRLLSDLNLTLTQMGTAFSGILRFFRTGFQQTGQFLSSTWSDFVNRFNSKVALIRSQFNSVIEGIKSTFNSLVGGAAAWGSRLVNNIASGIRSAIGAVRSAASSVASSISSFLRLSSPAEKGPLSTSDQWMPNLMKMFTQGLEMGIPQLEMAVGDVAATISTADPVASSSVVNNINVSSRNNTLTERGLGRMLERMRILNGGTF